MINPRLLIAIALAVVFFSLGYCIRQSEVQFVETIRYDTIWNDRVIERTQVEIPEPKIEVVTDTVFYTYEDTAKVAPDFAVPYFIQARGPVTRFELGGAFQFPTIREERIRYIQPSGFYAGVQIGQFPSISAAYLRGRWQFQYTYRPGMQGHEVGVLYRLSGK